MAGTRWLVPFVLILVPVLSPAQQAPPEPANKAALTPAQLEAEMNGKAVSNLLAFARQADAAKVRTKAKAAYELVLEYDGEQKSARDALGFKKDKSGWVAASGKAAPSWQDAPQNAQQAQKVTAAWEQVRKQLGIWHRTLGIELQSRGEAESAARHLARALVFDPGDKEAHRALGHHEYKGFYGTAEQIAFLERLAAIEQKAKELGSLDCKPQVLDAAAMPDELKRTGLTFRGAKTAHVTIWATAAAEDVPGLTQWGERTVAMLDFLLGPKAAEADVGGHVSRVGWYALLHNAEERDAFLNNNKQAFDIDVSLIHDFAGWSIRAGGGRAHVSWGHPGVDADAIVAHVATYGFAERCNQGLSEGLVHTLTSLMVDSMHTFNGTVPATVASRQKREDPTPERWWERLREQMDQHTDCPIAQLPRERLDNYRPELRMKVWSFVTWLLARYPDKWTDLLLVLPDQKPQARFSLEQATEAIEKALGRKVADIEAEWREWAGGTSPIAKASGHAR